MNETKTIKSANLFPVVGVGASAGGLDVFKKLIKSIPENSGMAYVLVQHLDPNHESLLPELLQKVTGIPVVEISDDIHVEPDHIYVIPSNKIMVANDGVLKLTNRPVKTKNKLNLPIDIFFSSLAEVHQSHAIGVVLSGNGNDGTMGLKAIKDYGGITFAQDEDSAAFESMPNSAINAGVVDFILSPEEIPQKILEIHKRIHEVPDKVEIVYRQDDDDVYKHIISLLRLRKGTDFTYYKQTTIRRRILRRMALNRFEEPAQYLKFLKEQKTEQDILYQDMLIPVTAFFRDDKVFDNLCETVFPLLVKNKTDYNPVRIWVAGCSTGEEAYTIAICMKEFLGDDQEKVQIIATDLSEPAIAKARSGIYSKNEINSLSPKCLNDFFTKTQHGYKVNKQIRDMCIFAVHNFLKDPPFGKIDFISCRNVMIYMEPYLQKKALTTFHYSLNPKGFLLLGKSETIASVPDLFVAVEKNNKLFIRKDIPGKFQHVASQRSEENLKQNNHSSKNTFITTDFHKIADDIILNKFAPAGVIVNDAMDIVHFRGNTNNFLEQLPGKPSHNLLKMAKYGLAFELRNILHKAKKEQAPAKKDNVILQINGQLHNISIEAIPLQNTLEPYYLLVFQDNHAISNEILVLNTKTSKSDKKELRILQLEQELIEVHEDMRSITEDQEAINEELQGDNEELLSRSEELQSLNEELETSKEELQSTNEELTVVNQEIVSLNELVSEARDYAEGIVSTMREPLLVLDKDLRVKTANNAYYKSFKVNEFDTIGKLIYEVDNEQWNIAELRNLLEKILPEKSSFNDFEIKHTFANIGERIMILNARELIKEQNSEKLILLAIEDNTEIRNKSIELQLKEKELLRKDIRERKVEKIKLEKAVIQRTKELAKANKTLVAQNKEKEEKSIELLKVNQQLIVEYVEKELRAAELVTANKELLYQNNEKEKRAAELIIANKELAFQNEEKARKEKELMIANKELQSFNYISSHDLQEPLRKIQIFAHRILEKENQNLSETGKDYFGRMQVSANRMQKLIEDLLAFSRLATADRKFENTDLQTIVAEVKADLKELIEEKHAIIETGAHCSASVIKFQFHQLICNLISNSLKFSKPKKPPHIVINNSIVKGNKLNQQNQALNNQLSPEKEYCHISISDDGIGFEEQYNKRIFEVFQRLHTEKEYKGTGIGLAIVKKIVENHHGIITANSIKNNGATFDIYLPVN